MLGLWKVRVAATLARKVMTRDGFAVTGRAIRAYERSTPATCPICGFEGRFDGYGLTNRPSARCPRCGSLERQRLIALAFRRGSITVRGRDVLHFAPEQSVTRLIEADGPASYVTADIEPGRAMVTLDLEAIAKPDASFDVVVASHVLEHVDDRKALAEIHRILRPGGLLIALVPIVEGWATTYENPRIDGETDRERYFGQWNHVRYYGADFRDRVRAPGFALDEFTADGDDSVHHALIRGEKIFLARKAGAPDTARTEHA